MDNNFIENVLSYQSYYEKELQIWGKMPQKIVSSLKKGIPREPAYLNLHGKCEYIHFQSVTVSVKEGMPRKIFFALIN